MNRYPTDQELMEWVEQLEQTQMYAPRHLKEEILLQAAEMDAALQKAERKPVRSKNKEFFVYSLKVIGSIAAVLLLLITIPVDSDSSTPTVKYEQEDQGSFGSRLQEGMNTVNEATSNFCRKINNITNSMVSEGFLNED